MGGTQGACAVRVALFGETEQGAGKEAKATQQGGLLGEDRSRGLANRGLKLTDRGLKTLGNRQSRS